MTSRQSAKKTLRTYQKLICELITSDYKCLTKPMKGLKTGDTVFLKKKKARLVSISLSRQLDIENLDLNQQNLGFINKTSGFFVKTRSKLILKDCQIETLNNSQLKDLYENKVLDKNEYIVAGTVSTKSFSMERNEHVLSPLTVSDRDTDNVVVAVLLYNNFKLKNLDFESDPNDKKEETTEVYFGEPSENNVENETNIKDSSKNSCPTEQEHKTDKMEIDDNQVTEENINSEEVEDIVKSNVISVSVNRDIDVKIDTNGSTNLESSITGLTSRGKHLALDHTDEMTFI